jgi:UDP-glucose 4-epimerase
MKSRDKLEWVAEKGTEDMSQDAWRWQKMNLNGY